MNSPCGLRIFQGPEDLLTNYVTKEVLICQLVSNGSSQEVLSRAAISRVTCLSSGITQVHPAWTLTADRRRRLDSFASISLCRILGYSWQDDRVSNQEMLRRAGMSRVTCLIRERQLRFYGHVVRFPMDDPAHRILNAKDPVGWNRRRGRPNSSWLAHEGMVNWPGAGPGDRPE